MKLNLVFVSQSVGTVCMSSFHVSAAFMNCAYTDECTYRLFLPVNKIFIHSVLSIMPSPASALGVNEPIQWNNAFNEVSFRTQLINSWHK